MGKMNKLEAIQPFKMFMKYFAFILSDVTWKCLCYRR